MSNSADKLVDAFYSAEANEIKNKVNSSLIKGIVLGLAAVFLFGMSGFALFVAISGFLPWYLSVPICLIPFICSMILIPVCWVFFGRAFYFRTKLTQHVNEQMMKSKSCP